MKIVSQSGSQRHTRRIASNAFDSKATASENIAMSLRTIAELDGDVRAFVHVDEKGARLTANALDSLEPGKRGPLHGVPIAVKEIFDVAGLRCSWGTAIHAERVPATDAVAVDILKSAGAIVTGTAVSSEYAIASTSRTRNPWDLSRTAGVSSSGSAAAVAAGMVPLAIGSQTIGSTIRPAGYCGVFGLKPTHGIVSLEGSMPLSATLDHVGIFAANTALLRTAFAVLSQKDDFRNSGLSADPASTTVQVLPPWNGDVFSEPVQASVDASAERLRELGFDVRYAAIPSSLFDEKDCLMDILSYDMARHHGGDFLAHADLMDLRVRRLIQRGSEISFAAYNAQKKRAARISSVLSEMLAPDGLFLTASTATVAPFSADGAGSRITQRIWTLAKLPAISVPFGFSDGLPVGVQLIGTKFSDVKLIDMATLLMASD